ncbi:aldo/keto reductase, partial [candidate division KSB1 bacterium]|nr:aldo/keto reductase [candidate division KSB1 bacterium]
MQTRKLGKNGPEITVIGLGTWAIGGPWQFGWGEQDDRDSILTIQKSLDLGINWVDTAPVYGFGHSEEIVCEALKGKRDKIILATKCGMVWNDRGRVNINLKPSSIRREIEDSLRRLDTDYVDLYQFHWPDPKTDVEESWQEMIKLKEEGKVRYVGVSNFDVPLLEKCMEIHHVDSLQPPYSMLERDVEKDILSYCEKNGIGVIAYSPMQAGLLTGKFDKSRLAPDDWRHKDQHFKEPNLSRNLEFVESLKPVAERHGKSIANLAVAWVLAHPAITSAIVGARNTDQAEENVLAAEIKLSEDDLNEIAQKL